MRPWCETRLLAPQRPRWLLVAFPGSRALRRRPTRPCGWSHEGRERLSALTRVSNAHYPGFAGGVKPDSAGGSRPADGAVGMHSLTADMPTGGGARAATNAWRRDDDADGPGRIVGRRPALLGLP